MMAMCQCCDLTKGNRFQEQMTDFPRFPGPWNAVMAVIKPSVLKEFCTRVFSLFLGLSRPLSPFNQEKVTAGALGGNKNEKH